MLRRSFINFSYHHHHHHQFEPGFLSRIQLPLHKAIFGVSAAPQDFQISTNESEEFRQDLIKYVCNELDLGYENLSKWRSTVQKYNTKSSSNDDPADPIQQLVQDCRQDLGITMSPTIGIAKKKNKGGYGLVARKNNIPPGMFLISVPSSSVMMAAQNENSPIMQQQEQDDESASGGNIFDQFFEGVESLSVPLFQNLINTESKFHRWVKFLHDHNANNESGEAQLTNTVKNLPYFVPMKVQPPPSSRLGMNLVVEYESRIHELTKTENKNTENNEKQNQQQLPPPKVLDALRGVPEHYLRWAASTVLSRRIAGNMLVPIVDFANHSSTKCNCFYTMAPLPNSNNNYDLAKITGLDFIDNLFAGVKNELLLEPHLHLFSIAAIKNKGDEITMSYSDIDPEKNHYLSEEEAQMEYETEKKNNKNVGASDAKKKETAGDDIKRTASSPRRPPTKMSAVEKQETGKTKDLWTRVGDQSLLEEKRKTIVDSGSDNWRLLYGFEPEFKTDTSLEALMTISKLIVRNRIVRRRELFPRVLVSTTEEK